jgi:dipeptidyl-peptidase-4
MRLKTALALMAALLVSTMAAAQSRSLTIDDLYDPAARINFSGNAPPSVTWIDATHFALLRQGQSETEWQSVDAVSGSTRLLFDASRMESRLSSDAAMSAADARQLARSRGLTFNRTYTAALFTTRDDLFVYTFSTDRVARLTTTDAREDLASFSPDSRAVAFVREHDLYVVDLASGRETRLTSDGGSKILNGQLDWVYEEEIFGRGQQRGYWWSPDSHRLAFLRIDDSPVPDYPVVDHIPYDPEVEHWDYPKAGDPNPIARLGMVAASGGAVQWSDTARYPDADRLIVAVSWAPDSKQVVFQVQNRLQSWLDLNLADAGTGSVRTLVHETSKAWLTESPPPVWLRDGSFLWLSERSGWQHLYHYAADGTLERQVTSGTWELRTLHGVDEARGWVYFSGTERSPIGGDVYRIRLDGSGIERLSKTPGSHRASFSPAFGFYVDVWSDVSTPPQVRLHRDDGSDVRVIEANRADALERFALPKAEFLQVKARDGFVMEAMIIKPPNFDPSRRYPVYQFVYGGPHNQQVRNAWASENLFLQLLAQQGIVVWECDNRTASGKGIESAWPVYRNFGELELRDIEDGLSWLKSQPYIDASRIGIHGWSYGGYLTSYALTHSTSFAMGIAGGTVSDWRNYDTVYTERYMGLPSDNEEGYRNSSPRWAAANLHGALLLLHGLTDDNVHVSNTIQLAYELQKAQKPFELMVYPRSRHGIADPALVKHMRRLMFDFVVRQLRPEVPAAGSFTEGR